MKTDAKKKLNSPQADGYKDVHNRLKKEGFKKAGQSGNHEKWRKGNRVVTVPNHGENYEIPIGTLNNIWRQAGWK
ncbi:MAG TPA: type II toxin-antitoxin system HicA family toxin [Candidatus Enterenecus merdae]|nr:type II toxin-antitoxin system HicA family toxin [Candidatus Enterenecus merdae]